MLDWWYSVPLLIYLSLLAVYTAYLIFGAFNMASQVFLKSWTEPGINAKSIALTFDDGPNEHTIAVLDTLKKYDAKASFFCIGKQMAAHTQIVSRMIAEGHTIGNHSYDHKKLFPMQSIQRMVSEIKQTNSIIEKLTGKTARFFRPPFGVTNPNLAKAVEETGQQVVGWNLRTFDTVKKNKSKLAVQIIKRIRPGSVILLHDNRAETSQLLELVLIFTSQNGYQCLPVDELFKLNNPR